MTSQPGLTKIQSQSKGYSRNYENRKQPGLHAAFILKIIIRLISRQEDFLNDILGNFFLTDFRNSVTAQSFGADFNPRNNFFFCFLHLNSEKQRCENYFYAIDKMPNKTKRFQLCSINSAMSS